MPNLKPPVTTTARALGYREEILKALPPGSSFEPLMTLYLTDNTSPEEIKLASMNYLNAVTCSSDLFSSSDLKLHLYLWHVDQLHVSFV
jgi:dihydroorotase